MTHIAAAAEPAAHVAERLRALRARAGLSVRAMARALGYAGGSSYQRYEDPALFGDGPLPLWLVRKLVPALEGRGVPPIAAEEIYALGGVLPPAERPRAAPPGVTLPTAPALPPFATMPRDVPVHGTVVGGTEGDFEMNGTVVDYVRRPPGIAGAREVFALYVTGDSMEPRYRPGDLVYVNPSRPPRAGDDVVVELLPAEGRDGAGPAFVKTLRARAPGAWVCEQYNPPRLLEYPVARVRHVLRIMTLTELLGA